MDVTLSNVPYFDTPPIRFLIHSVILPSHTLYRYEDTALHGKKCKNKAKETHFNGCNFISSKFDF